MPESTRILNDFIAKALQTNDLLVRNVLLGYENQSQNVFYYLIELSNRSKYILMFSKYSNNELHTHALSNYFNDDININLATMLDDFDEEFNTNAMERIIDNNYFAINQIESITNPKKTQKEFAKYCLSNAKINDGSIIKDAISVLYK